MAMTTTDQINPTVSGAYSRRLLSRLVNDFIYYGYGEERPFEANMGPTLTFRRFANFTAATTALTEGVTPAGSQASHTDLTITIYQYGDFMIHTDWLDMVGIDGKVTRWIDDILKDQVKDTLDQLARDIMHSSVSQIHYCVTTTVGTARTDVNDKLEQGDFDYVLNLLKRASVPMIREKIQPGTGYSTSPLQAGYIAIGHVDLQKDIEGLSSFVSVEKYAQPGKALPGEIGAVCSGQIRIVLTNNGKIFTDAGAAHSSATTYRALSGGTKWDVYPLIVFGKGFYANSRLNGNALEMIIKQKGSSGVADPLNQRGSVGWKLTYGGSILQDARGVRIECCATNLAAAAL